MRALVIGGTGFVGRLVCKLLTRLEWDTTVFALHPPERESRVSFVRGDRRDESDLRALARGHDYDVVVDLVAYHPEETKVMVKLWGGRIERFVHLSTVSVYKRLHSTVATEEMAERWAETDGSYGAQKAMCEVVLEAAYREEGFPYVTLRASPLMGPGDPVSRENYILKRILTGRRLLHPAPADGFLVTLYVEDLGQAIVRSLYKEKVLGRAYHLAQREHPSVANHIRTIAALAGVCDVEFEELSPAELALRGFRVFAFPYAVPPSQRFDIGRATVELGFEPTPYLDALKKTVEWFLARDSKLLPAWPGRGSLQSRLCGTHEWLQADLERRSALSQYLPSVTHTDDVLDQLTGWQIGSDRRLLVPLESWQEGCPSVSTPPPDSCSQAGVVLVPSHVMNRIMPDASTDSAVCTGGRTAWPSASELPSAWQLDGILEPLAADEGDAQGWLYAQASPGLVQTYHHNNGVLKVRFESYRALNPDGIPEGERLVVSIRDSVDSQAFCSWLSHCDKRGYVRISSISSWSRVFVTQLCRWLPFTIPETVQCWTTDGRAIPMCRCAISERSSQTHAERDGTPCRYLPPFLLEAYQQMQRHTPGAGRWAGIYGLARLLCRSGAELPDEEVHVRISGATQPLFVIADQRGTHFRSRFFRLREGLLLFAAHDKFFVGDLREKRLYEISRRLAALLEVVERARNLHQAVEIYGSVVGCSIEQARRLCEVGLRELSRSRIVESMKRRGRR